MEKLIELQSWMTDAEARRLAVDPRYSSIVRAPAGSGKTTLLVERVLRLLLVVSDPTQIVVLTFTRKAKAELEQRLLFWLSDTNEELQKKHPQANPFYLLAKQVKQRAEQLSWILSAWQAVETLDGFCLRLVIETAPDLHQLSSTELSLQPQSLYFQAGEMLLRLAPQQPEWQAALELFCQGYDYDLAKLNQDLSMMLSQREYWTDLAWQDNISFQAAWQQWLLKIRQQTVRLLQPWWRQIHEQLEWVLSVSSTDSLQIIVSWSKLSRTAGGEWKKRWTKHDGLATAEQLNQHQKLRRSQWLTQQLALVTAMQQVTNLDWYLDCFREFAWEIPAYDQKVKQTQCIQKLLQAAWEIVMRENNCCDLSAIQKACFQLLSDEFGPTDRLLQLDQQFSHFLIDEWQDTSPRQADMIALLVSGWQPDDAKSLFLVGDPWQGIYRFRQADMRVFLNWWEYPPLNFPLTKLTLTKNFRTEPALLAWINQQMQDKYRTEMDAMLGVMPYQASDPATQATEKSPVHWYVSSEQCGWIGQTVAVLKQLQIQHPDWQVAILLPTRQGIHELLAAAKAEQVAIQAHELLQLWEHAAAQDFLSLYQAIYDIWDNLAHCAVLRAPWIGLSLSELADISGLEGHWLDKLNQCEQSQITSWRDFLRRRQDQAAYLPISYWLHAGWQLLGGHLIYADETSQEVVDQLMAIIVQHADPVGKSVYDLQSIWQHALVSTAGSCPCQVMTIHKAKGLEFDAVLLPQLSQKGLADTQSLWLGECFWHEGKPIYLLACKDLNQEKIDPHYRLILKWRQRQAQCEKQRLLYVALTRTKRQLHIWWPINDETGELRSAPVNTLLQWLPPPDQDYLTKHLSVGQTPATNNYPVVSIANLTSFQQAIVPLLNWDPENKPTLAHPLRLPEARAAELGTLVHQQLAVWCQNRRASKIFKPLQWRWHALQLRVRLSHSQTLWLERCMMSLQSCPILQQIWQKNLHIENRFWDPNLQQAWQVDLWWQEENGMIWILDWKTDELSGVNQSTMIQFWNHHISQLQQYRTLFSQPQVALALYAVGQQCLVWQLPDSRQIFYLSRDQFIANQLPF